MSVGGGRVKLSRFHCPYDKYFGGARRIRLSMLSGIKIWFIKSPWEDVGLLGRKTGDYLRREFADYDCDTATCKEECSAARGEINVYLPLDMPLVTAEDLARGVECLRRRRLSVLHLGKGTGAEIRFGDGTDGGYFLTSPHFCKVNGAKSLNLVYNQIKERIIGRLLAAEVCITDAANTVIDDTVKIFPGARILPFCRLCGATVVAGGATVDSSYVSDSIIEEGASVVMSHVTDSRVGACADVGPFARLRGADVGGSCRIGDFVEIKASRLADGVKSAHLAYVGDADVGAGTNIGCGAVFCNYDGCRKHRTQVGEGCFIGANVNLVAPLTVADGAYVAAGTTVTEDVGKNDFVIGRSRQQNKKKNDGADVGCNRKP